MDRGITCSLNSLFDILPLDFSGIPVTVILINLVLITRTVITSFLDLTKRLEDEKMKRKEIDRLKNNRDMKHKSKKKKKLAKNTKKYRLKT